MSATKSWDIFCAVVDNYGDIGVCWRLARQLVAEHGCRVRLWVDHLGPFHRLCPEIDPQLAEQVCRGVQVRHWVVDFPQTETADVVVEAFACILPESYVAAMAARERQPVWINLEYLSAEEWVAGSHGLPSPQPQGVLVKYFFFPGFTPATGGLPREAGLLARRDAWRRDEDALAGFWRSLGLRAKSTGELRVSLFCYPNHALRDLFAVWQTAGAPVTCLVPQGVAMEEVSCFFGQSHLHHGSNLCRGNLEVRILPFLEQDQYDRLLWACDLNFVRGEDSFVRAQWAARPFVWHIYPQEGMVHWGKLRAFLGRFAASLPSGSAAAIDGFWTAWNRGAGAGEAWPEFHAHLGRFDEHVAAWAELLGEDRDLASKLVRFCTERV